ncbi:TPR repeat-containing thioredoxin TTL1 [Platanthera zijinensis]|uniref:TPR repeat-containing thioredoxin TTL1 n=1 Tax=Platanthera zijinensis TaxID=2320716 RepID=A0AAP0B8B4_9ASPA
MSNSVDARGKTLKPYLVESVSDQFNTAVSFERNKPDAKDFRDLGSPVSPLRIRSATVTAATSSSSSSSGSFGKPTPNSGTRKSDGGQGRSHSGEISGSSEESELVRSGTGRSCFSGGGVSSSVSSPSANVFPAGNICPSGKVAKTGMTSRKVMRSDVLGSGTGNYGHGSIFRAGAVDPGKMDAEEATKAGNEHYKKGQFSEAMGFYDRAVEVCSGNAACRNNRAAALCSLGRLGEAVKECEEAIRLNPSYGKAHHRLFFLYLRLGQVESARRHLLLVGRQLDHTEMLKLHTVERHLERCGEARKMGDWKSTLREADFTATTGADYSPLISALRAEALLHLHRLEEAESALSKALKYEMESSSPSSKFLGMLSNSYICFTQAQVEMALGRFENAMASVEKARQIDPHNIEVSVMWNNVNSVARARSQGNQYFKLGNFADACTAYSEGLKYDPLNPVLYCNRAACCSKLGQWVKSLEDCNEALRIHPTYIKALLRRAASYAKLEKWIEAVRDYDVLSRELPADTEVSEALFNAKVALKESRGEKASNMKFGGVVENILGLIELQAAVALPGVSIVYFMSASNHHCSQTTPSVEALCTRFPFLNFMKVEVSENQDIFKAENVRIVPTVKIYKNGARVKEMICPSLQVLEFSLQLYGI